MRLLVIPALVLGVLAGQLLAACSDGLQHSTITVRAERFVTYDCGGGNCSYEHLVLTADGAVFNGDSGGLYSVLGVGHTYRIGWEPAGYCDEPRPCIEAVYQEVR